MSRIVEVHAPRLEGGRIFDEWVPVKVLAHEANPAYIMAKVPGCSVRWFGPGQWREPQRLTERELDAQRQAREIFNRAQVGAKKET